MVVGKVQPAASQQVSLSLLPREQAGETRVLHHALLGPKTSPAPLTHVVVVVAVAVV